MKSFNTAFLLLAAATLTIGAASAQTAPNAKPGPQGRALPSPRPVFGNFQIGATLRSAALDNVSYIEQQGLGNFSQVLQTGRQHVADMVQINENPTNPTPANRGNDGYQTQNNGTGTTGRNNAYMLQIGDGNYADQFQSGNLNVALVTQGNFGTNGGRDENYSVQCQTGSNNYGYVDQNSNKNFAHQDQKSPIGTSLGGGLSPSSSANGNWADTRQGGNGGAGVDGQWSQILQNGNNNRASVRQDNP